MKERVMTIAQAQEFVGKVLAIIEDIMPSMCDIETRKIRRGGRVQEERVVIDYSDDYERLPGYQTYAISYYVMSHEDDVAAIRKEQVREGAYLTTEPFEGAPEDAADYLLAELREGYNEDAA